MKSARVSGESHVGVSLLPLGVGEGSLPSKECFWRASSARPRLTAEGQPEPRRQVFLWSPDGLGSFRRLRTGVRSDRFADLALLRWAEIFETSVQDQVHTLVGFLGRCADKCLVLVLNGSLSGRLARSKSSIRC